MATIGYYYGTGFDDKSGNGLDATAVGTVPQPAGGPTAGNWLVKGNLTYDTDYISFSPALYNDLTEIVYEFYINIPSATPNTAILFTSLVENNVADSFYIFVFGGVFYTQQVIGGVALGGFGVSPPTYDSTVLVRMELDAAGIRVYYDGVLAGSNGTAFSPVTGYTWFTIGPKIAGNAAFTYTNAGIDGFAVFDDVADTYPPVITPPTPGAQVVYTGGSDFTSLPNYILVDPNGFALDLATGLPTTYQVVNTSRGTDFTSCATAIIVNSSGIAI